MNPVINPSTINILSGTQEAPSNPSYVSYATTKPTQTRWGRFKTWISEICEAFKPVVEIFVSFVSTAAMFMNAYGRYKSCKISGKEGIIAC